MISLLCYDEFGKNMGLPSLVDSFSETRYEDQDKIVDYLKSGEVCMIGMGRTYDVITGEEIEHEKIYMGDGEFLWSSALIYYVDKYNLMLPQSFTQHALRH